MEIKSELLDYVFALFESHQPLTLTGEYDGINGSIAMTFVADTNTYNVYFTYKGSEYNQFREIVAQSAGDAVKEHNDVIGVPNRDAFIESVTE